MFPAAPKQISEWLDISLLEWFLKDHLTLQITNDEENALPSQE